jgi:hypothetical protein
MICVIIFKKNFIFARAEILKHCAFKILLEASKLARFVCN